MAENKTDYTSMFADHVEHSDSRQDHAYVIADKLSAYLNPASVVDVGCGMGFFLKAMSEKGAKVAGIDGPWVEDIETVIPKKKYTFHDLEKPIVCAQRFDLAASLEVAEHLSKDREDSFVSDLCSLSDYVLFSAAIPGQKGKGHINTKWQGAWAEKFARHGYRCYDPLRRKLAFHDGMAQWFIQNLLIYVKDGAEVSPLLADHEIPPDAASYILPRWHIQRVRFLKKQLNRLRDESGTR